MKESQIQKLKLQLDEALQMLRLVAAEERTCVEVREWLEINHPDDDTKDGQPIMDLLMKGIHKNGR